MSEITRFAGYRGLLEEHGVHLGEVARIPATKSSLNRSHLRPRIPVVVQGLMDEWPARTKWTFDFFKSHYGDVQVPTGVVFSNKTNQSLSEYIDYLQSHERGDPETEGPPIYMEGWYFRAHNDELCRDFQVPDCLRDDWFERFYPEHKNPKGTGILMGPKGAFTKLHTDGQCTHTWLAQFVGRKHWVLVDYDQLSGLFGSKYECNGKYEGFEHPGLEDWLKNNRVEYWTCNLQPGEVVVLPGNWFHQVTSLDASISLTHNFFNGTNARRVLWEMMRTRFGRESEKAG
ncbi:MAG: cupin-like domain-containing protein [Planctomycetota bacterium]